MLQPLRTVDGGYQFDSLCVLSSIDRKHATWLGAKLTESYSARPCIKQDRSSNDAMYQAIRRKRDVNRKRGHITSRTARDIRPPWTWQILPNMSDKITPFDPNISKEEVDRLFRKLADTRLPQIPIVPDAGDEYGISLLIPLHRRLLILDRPIYGLDQQGIQPLALQVRLVRCARTNLRMAPFHDGGREHEGAFYSRESKEEAQRSDSAITGPRLAGNVL